MENKSKRSNAYYLWYVTNKMKIVSRRTRSRVGNSIPELPATNERLGKVRLLRSRELSNGGCNKYSTSPKSKLQGRERSTNKRLGKVGLYLTSPSRQVLRNPGWGYQVAIVDVFMIPERLQSGEDLCPECTAAARWIAAFTNCWMPGKHKVVTSEKSQLCCSRPSLVVLDFGRSRTFS